MNSTRSQSWRVIMATRAAVPLVLALALSGCIKMDVDLTLDDDRVDGSMIIGVNRALLDMTGSTVEEFLAEIDAGDDIPEGATARPYEDDVYVGQEYVLDGVELAEFDNEVMSITHDADAGSYEVTGEIDMTDIGAEAAELGEFDASISITFPGEVTEHNGTLDGRTVTWTPVLGDVNEMHATARDSGGSGLPGWLFVTIGAAVAALLAGLVLFLALRSRASTDSASAGDESSVPADVEKLGDAESHGDTRPLDLPTLPDQPAVVDGESKEADEAPSSDRPAGV